MPHPLFPPSQLRFLHCWWFFFFSFLSPLSNLLLPEKPHSGEISSHTPYCSHGNRCHLKSQTTTLATTQSLVFTSLGCYPFSQQSVSVPPFAIFSVLTYLPPSYLSAAQPPPFCAIWLKPPWIPTLPLTHRLDHFLSRKHFLPLSFQDLICTPPCWLLPTRVWLYLSLWPLGLSYPRA